MSAAAYVARARLRAATVRAFMLVNGSSLSGEQCLALARELGEPFRRVWFLYGDWARR